MGPLPLHLPLIRVRCLSKGKGNTTPKPHIIITGITYNGHSRYYRTRPDKEIEHLAAISLTLREIKKTGTAKTDKLDKLEQQIHEHEAWIKLQDY